MHSWMVVVKQIESICRYVQSIIALTYTETEKRDKISETYHKVNEATRAQHAGANSPL